VIEEKIDDSLVFLWVVLIHEAQPEVPPFLLVNLDPEINLNEG